MSDQALEQVAKRLRDLGKNLEKNPPSQQQIDRWRKQAEDLLDKSTPEQREQLQRLAEKMTKEMPEQQDGDRQAPQPSSPTPNASGGARDRSSPEPSSSDDHPAPSSRDGNLPSPTVPEAAGGDKRSSGGKPQNFPGSGVPNVRDAAGKKGSTGGAGSDAGRSAAPRRVGPTPQPWTGKTETVDARPKSVPEGSKPRVLAEVLNPNGTERRTSSSEPSLGGELREAAKGAERAIEQQGVPNARTEYIRRVMRRYAERASSVPQPGATADPAKPAPTPDAADASPNPKK